MVTERNRNQRRQMKDLIHTLHRGAHTVRVPHIPGKNFNLVKFFLRQRIQPAPVVERIVIYKCFYIIALFQKALGQMASDKTVCSGYQYFFHCSFMSFLNRYSDFKFSFSSIRCISSNSPISRKESSLIGYIPTWRCSARSLSARSVI